MLLFLLPLLAVTGDGIPETPTAPPRLTCDTPAGLTALLANGVLDQRGLVGLRLHPPGLPGHAEESLEAWSFRGRSRVALLIQLPEAVLPASRIFRATLRASSPRSELKVVGVLQLAPTPTEPDTRVVVEAEAEFRDARGVYTLELQDAEGQRLLVLTRVRFPPL